MKSIVDLLPGAAFIIVFILEDIFLATLALLAGLIIQMAVYVTARWPIPKYMWVILGIGTASAGLTLILQNPMFVKLRPSIVSAFISALILGSQYFGKANFLEKILGMAVTLPRRAWRALAWIWIGCLLGNAALNALIAYQMSDNFWLSYRIVSAFVMPVILIGTSAIYLWLTNQSPKFKVPDKET